MILITPNKNLIIKIIKINSNIHTLAFFGEFRAKNICLLTACLGWWIFRGLSKSILNLIIPILKIKKINACGDV